jgi:hypothetical protein
MPDQRNLELLIRSRIPLIAVNSHDENRVLNLINRVCIRRGMPVFKWSVTEGLQRADINLAPQTFNMDPAMMLGHIKSGKQPGVYVLFDFHPYLTDPKLVRLLKDIALDYAKVERTLVFVSHEINLPGDLRKHSAGLELSLPDETRLRAIVEEVAQEWQGKNGKRVRADKRALDLLVRNLLGLSDSDARRLARGAIFNDGAISHDDIDAVMQAKYHLLGQDGLLSFEYETAKFSEVGGMNRLKEWLQLRKAVFTGSASTRGLDPPKGILLLGVQGCGKSLIAKATAGIFGVPLLRLDFGALYTKWYGESEKNLRDALRMAEVMAPCVLWVDEIEKGISGDTNDEGTSRRVLGTLLTWMAERKSRVFLTATANDIERLPPELMRKGRFDEIFFVDLPTPEVRKEIFGIHLKKRALDGARFDLDRLAQAADGFSGAEIEQAVVSAMYRSHAHSKALDTSHILQEIEQTRPLSVVMAEKVERLRDWARERTVPSH